MTNPISVRLPGLFWVKVVDGIAAVPAPAPAPAPAPSPAPADAGGVKVMDPGRPPRLTEYGVSEMGTKVKLMFAPTFPHAPFVDVEAANAWRAKNSQWFTGAHSIHLVEVDA